MLFRRLVFVGLLSLGALFLTGCESIIESLFGQTVEVDHHDSSAPVVSIMIADRFVTVPETGDFVALKSAETATVLPTFTIAVVGEDVQGVQYTELDDITVTPYCGQLSESQADQSAPSSAYRWSAEKLLRGGQVEVAADSVMSSVRIPYILSLSFGLHNHSELCPADRPVLGNARLLLKAHAGNFGNLKAETGVVTLYLNNAGLNSPDFPAAQSSSSKGPASCAGEGDACVTQPFGCFGRGTDWTVPGKIQCRSGKPVCVAEMGRDYCSGCGGICGRCLGDTCSESDPCAPGSVCVSESLSAGTASRCRPITRPGSGMDYQSCTVLDGFCWTPEEAGQARLICSEEN